MAGLPGWPSGQESDWQEETWVQLLGREDPLEKERLTTPIFLLGEFHRLYSTCGPKESDMTEQLSLMISQVTVE